MISPMLEQELREHLSHLAIEQQRQVVDFARALAITQTRGVSGQTLLQFAGTIEADDVAMMSEAIKDGCERVNSDDW